ncbi:diguanylate cyclase (GGDEF) domain-containing protein [Quadrisphaera granulorum]|uniref:Diguanylate cyclase (GGDEF)-like protein n=1 Tax=Quadrisphaera granulorum TaxID=317664 RepID=A0A316A1T4_9ACTN|nr:GGDEF domain-containing protein [Quadrisphaera granulorum]PWJ51811.1 diguanylate cyclase (GGDEF)-like protein [Quadrisphaera granulorum]SZE97758.1 diguanylate cyclase (GGDEF) domain-containing protein [Quadrisphaera granulorum]
MTDPAWGVRVLGVAGSIVIAVVLALDGFPHPPDAKHLVSVVACLASAAVFSCLSPRTHRRIAAVMLPAGPAVGCTNITIAMRVADSPTTAMTLSLLYVWFVTFCDLYGRRWHSLLALSVTAPGLAIGLWGQIGGLRAVIFAMSTVVVLSVSSVVLRAVCEQVRRASTTDVLTGVLSRRGLAEQAPAFAARARSRGQRVAVVVLDLDGFKTFNDVHGHAAGDGLLTRAAAAWRAMLPVPSLLARTGGDEFVALVTSGRNRPAVDPALLDALRRAAPDGVRASAGAATWMYGTTLETATHEADRSMYLDKGERRRGEARSPSPPEPRSGSEQQPHPEQPTAGV